MKRSRRLVLLGIALAAVASARPALAQAGLQFYAVTPCRAVDTRSGNGGIIAAATLRNFTIKGVCNVPGTAKAVSLNATIASPTVDGFFSLWPAGTAFPTVSTLNFLAGEAALANGAIVPLNTSTTPDLSTAYGTGSGAGTTHVIIDVTGYFQ